VREEESLLVEVRDGRVALGGGIGGTAFDAEAGTVPATVPSFLEAVLTDEVRSVETFEVGVTMGLFTINSAPVSDFPFGVS
jgi:hypothetical protein